MTRKALLNREFSTREKGMILAFALVLVAAFYYFAVVQNVSTANAESQALIDDLQVQVEAQQNIALKRMEMERGLESLANRDSLPQVRTYDNFRKEWDELNAILKGATSFQLNFGEAVATGDLVRRPVELSFTAPSYAKALALVDRIRTGTNYCLVNGFGMSQVSNSVGDKSGVGVSIQLTFFETAKGAHDLSGLTYATEKG